MRGRVVVEREGGRSWRPYCSDIPAVSGSRTKQQPQRTRNQPRAPAFARPNGERLGACDCGSHILAFPSWRTPERLPTLDNVAMDHHFAITAVLSIQHQRLEGFLAGAELQKSCHSPPPPPCSVRRSVRSQTHLAARTRSLRRGHASSSKVRTVVSLNAVRVTSLTGKSQPVRRRYCLLVACQRPCKMEG